MHPWAKWVPMRARKGCIYADGPRLLILKLILRPTFRPQGLSFVVSLFYGLAVVVYVFLQSSRAVVAECHVRISFISLFTVFYLRRSRAGLCWRRKEDVFRKFYIYGILMI